MDNKNVIKASVWYTISNFILKGLGFITTPIFARILTQSEYGYFNNFSSWLSIITIIATLSLGTSLVRARFDYEQELNSFVASNLLLGTSWTIVICLLIFSNKSFFVDFFDLEYKYIILMCINMLVSPAYGMFLQTQRFRYKYKLVVFVTIGMAIASIILSLFLIHLCEDNAFARTLGAQLPTIVLAVIMYAYFVFTAQKIRKEYCIYSLKICVPYLFHLLSCVILNSSDRIMITKFCGPESTALYSMAYNIAMIANLLWDSLNQAYSPWLGEKLNQKEYESIKKYSYAYIAIFTYVLVAFMIIAPEAMMILGGERYINAKYVIPPVMLGYLFVFLYSLYVNIEQYERRTGAMAVGTMISTLLNIVLNFVFIPRYGYIAASYTTLVGYVFLFVFHYFIVCKIKMNVYDTKYIVFIIVGVTLFSLLMLVSYQINIIRYVLGFMYLLITIILLMKNKDLIMLKIKKKM